MNSDDTLPFSSPKFQLKNEQRVVVALIITILGWLVLPQGLIFFIDFGFDAVILFSLQYVFALAPLGVYAIIRRDGLKFLGFRDRINLKILLYGLLLPIALLTSAFVIIITFVTLFGYPQIPDTGVTLNPGNSFLEFVRLTLFVFFVNAPAEEIFFRRYLQKELTETAGFGVGLIITSLIFGVLHYATASITAINAFVLSIILGYAYHRTKSLYTTWIGHGLYNVILFYLAFLLAPFLLV